MPIATEGTAAFAADKPMGPWKYELRDLRPTDVHMKVKFCGICHSDVHQVRDEWSSGAIYPMVPGHEVVGEVVAVGAKVTKLRVGDIGAIGCMVDSCQDHGTCRWCKMSEEQRCAKCVFTYNCKGWDGVPTYGGYGRDIVANEHFVLKVPAALTTPDKLPSVAPILCAGITMWAPIRRWGADKPGARVGVLGLGGLGHMAVKLAVALGQEVTVISTSEKKRKEAIEEFGAKHFIISKNEEEMKKAAGTLDIIFDTIAAHKPMQMYMNLLAPRGKMICIAVPPKGNPVTLDAEPLIVGDRALIGSVIGGIRDTQGVLDFCAEKNILPKCEIIKADKVNEAYDRIVKSDVRYRFVIDVQNS